MSLVCCMCLFWHWLVACNSLRFTSSTNKVHVLDYQEWEIKVYVLITEYLCFLFLFWSTLTSLLKFSEVSKINLRLEELMSEKVSNFKTSIFSLNLAKQTLSSYLGGPKTIKIWNSTREEDEPCQSGQCQIIQSHLATCHYLRPRPPHTWPCHLIRHVSTLANVNSKITKKAPTLLYIYMLVPLCIKNYNLTPKVLEIVNWPLYFLKLQISLQTF